MQPILLIHRFGIVDKLIMGRKYLQKCNCSKPVKTFFLLHAKQYMVQTYGFHLHYIERILKDQSNLSENTMPLYKRDLSNSRFWNPQENLMTNSPHVQKENVLLDCSFLTAVSLHHALLYLLKLILAYSLYLNKKYKIFYFSPLFDIFFTISQHFMT